MKRRAWPVVLATMVTAGVGLGCSSVDPTLLDTDVDAGRSSSDGQRDAGRDAGDSAAPDEPQAGMGGMAGMPTGGTGGETADGGGGGADGGSAGGPDAGPVDECRPNPDTNNQVCPEICPETCDDVDNDCDRRVDEGSADADCDAEHATTACNDGECIIISCEPGFRDCDSDPANGCEADENDVNNCGPCGRVCQLPNALVACIDGQCVPTGCIDLFHDCDDNVLDCETPGNTLGNCGGCGMSCSNVMNATADCTTGVCGPGVCSEGYDDCDRDPSNGCEQALSDTANCGECGTPCDFPNSTSDDCSGRTCIAGTCDAGYDDCDGDRSNGCESLEDDANCGGCGQTCDGSLDNAASASCSAAGCDLVCADGFGDCDTNPFTGCEASLTTRNRCGACDTPCAYDNMVVSCATGTCEPVRCEDGWGDCNGELADGCEEPLDQDTFCGSCDTDCTGTVTPFCAGGQCTAVDCAPGTADCDGDGLDCEVDTTDDEMHCGSCDNACQYTTGTPNATAAQCVNSMCQAPCTGLHDDCNGDYADGCETSLETLADCGSCDTVCSIQNAMETCSGGNCTVANCEPDAGDCDADPLTCETPLDTVDDCGDCGDACNTTNAIPACVGTPGDRVCTISSCTASHFADCDVNASTGCEVDTRTDIAHCGACNFDCRTQDNVDSATCSGSGCNFTCSAGFDDCNGMDNDGCETPLNTLANCQGCGVACTRANGTASCTSGTCSLTGCNPGYSNCDSNTANGCEPLNTLADCGGCGAACTVENGTGDCSSGSCAVGSCDAGWDDCDGDPANGCEQDVRSPAMGGVGPCFPDSNCIKADYMSVSYYFCRTERDWATARDNCRLLINTELVRIDSQGENDFVLANIVAESFMGANDRSVDGQWRWTTPGSDDGAQFWMGDGATGTQVGGLFVNWVAGEPNGAAASGCGRMVLTGEWRDIECTTAYDYVCEQNGDLCPADPNKTAPGICGCGVSDADDDSDGTPNCNDPCLNDPLKTAPGQCGCGVPDADSDDDGVADCMDDCPLDAGQTVAPCGWLPSNFDPSMYPHSAGVNFDCGGTHTFDSTTQLWDTSCCGQCPDASAPVDQTTAGGPQVVVVSMQSLNVAAGTTIRLIGDYPVILSVDANGTINGTIDAGSSGATPGAGGNEASCGNGDGGNGGSNSGRGAGGGGGGFGTNGGVGGGSCLYCCPSSPAAGQQNGNTSLSPLRGGCHGGNGGAGGGVGGAGGGAVQVAVQGMLTLGASAIVSAAGGGGARGAGGGDGGGGGGSGGGVLLEYSGGYSNLGALRVHGGGGGEASSSSSSTGNGENGHRIDDTRAAGGTGGSGHDGGLGATRCITGGAACTAADAGATGGAMSQSLICVGGGGSGGGGGGGRVAVSAR